MRPDGFCGSSSCECGRRYSSDRNEARCGQEDYAEAGSSVRGFRPGPLNSRCPAEHCRTHRCGADAVRGRRGAGPTRSNTSLDGPGPTGARPGRCRADAEQYRTPRYVAARCRVAALTARRCRADMEECRTRRCRVGRCGGPLRAIPHATVQDRPVQNWPMRAWPVRRRRAAMPVLDGAWPAGESRLVRAGRVPGGSRPTRSNTTRPVRGSPGCKGVGEKC